ncbi:MAG: hypothetical protein J3K34DRAFT_427168 [Monoraphidium minutum]|nr:MAG: hypothetical protein J3K34DRAFT_427168 [Monoraphidium minutum]
MYRLSVPRRCSFSGAAALSPPIHLYLPSIHVPPLCCALTRLRLPREVLVPLLSVYVFLCGGCPTRCCAASRAAPAGNAGPWEGMARAFVAKTPRAVRGRLRRAAKGVHISVQPAGAVTRGTEQAEGRQLRQSAGDQGMKAGRRSARGAGRSSGTWMARRWLRSAAGMHLGGAARAAWAPKQPERTCEQFW